MIHPRRPWTPQDDAHLRLFHAEGKDDKTIGYIINRAAKVVHRHRKAMGLKAVGKPGPAKGSFKHTDERKAKIREGVTQRWREDEQFRKAAIDALARGRQANEAKRWHVPTDPAELKVYKKIRALMGAKFAKTALRETTTTAA